MKNTPGNIAKQFVTSLFLTIGFDMVICPCSFVLCTLFSSPHTYTWALRLSWWVSLTAKSFPLATLSVSLHPFQFIVNASVSMWAIGREYNLCFFKVFFF